MMGSAEIWRIGTCDEVKYSGNAVLEGFLVDRRSDLDQLGFVTTEI